MAVPIVESTSAANNWFGDDITVTAPSGIQDGDLLIAIGLEIDNANSITLPSGFTSIIEQDTSTILSLVAGYKVASSESGNYTFATASTTAGAAVVYRISGAAAVVNSGGDSNISVSSTIAKPSDSLVIYAAGSRGDNSLFSDYILTHSGSNLSWTEIGETNTTAGNRGGFVTAYGTTTDKTNITDISSTVTGTGIDTVSIGLAVLSAQNATGTFAHLSVSPAFTAPTASVGTTGTFAHLSPTIAVNNPSGTGRTKTWTTTTKS